MPTRRGWAGTGVCALLTVLWAIFGEGMLLAIAVFLLAAVTGGIVYVRVSSPRIGVTREVSPNLLHEGESTTVCISLIAHSRVHRVRVTDVVQGLGSATFVGDNIASGDDMVGTYQVLCRPRGVYRVGPSRITVADPFGFANATATIGAIDRLVVFPKVEDLVGVPTGRGQDQTINTSRASFWHSAGEDFFTLREYHQGDDLRRVHWPSTARRDDIMIKQLEMPWQSRALILFDPRTEAHASPKGFEHAVSGAASVLKHLYRSGYTPTLWAGSGEGTVVGHSRGYTAAMEELATITPKRSTDLTKAVTRLRRSGMAGGVLVVVTGELDDPDLAAMQLLGQEFFRTVLMTSRQSTSDENQPVTHLGATMVDTTPQDGWAEAWRNAMERGWNTVSPG